MKRPSPLHLLACLPLAAACQAPAEGGAKDTPAAADASVAARVAQVEVLRLAPRTFEDRIEVTGALEAVQDATMSAQSAGTVQTLLELGTAVQKGQILATLDAELLGAAVKQAEAGVEVAKTAAALAEDNFERQKPLADEGIISALEFKNISAQRAQAQAQLSQAQAALTQAQKQLANSRVISPFAGVVEAHLVERGEQVNPGQAVVRVTDTRTMKVKAGVPERYAADIKRGAAVRIAFNAYGLAPKEGRLTFVGRTIDAKNRTFQVEAELDNPDGTLKPEMVARLLVTRAQLEGALTVPLAAVVRDEGGEAVFVVSRGAGGTKAERRVVETGVTSGNEVVIVSGLSPGDEVVVSGQTNLTQGDAVEVSRARGDAQANSAP